MRPIHLLFPLLLLTLLPALAGHSPPKILLRVHVQTTGDGLSPQQATTVTLPNDGETIQIRTFPEVTEQELIGVKADAAGNLQLFFNHQGQVNLSAVTAENQGRLLVVMIGANIGYPIYAPMIDTQITNGELDIPHTHPLPPEVVQLLQDEAKENVRQATRS